MMLCKFIDFTMKIFYIQFFEYWRKQDFENTKWVLIEDDEAKSCLYLRWRFWWSMTKEIYSQSYFDHLACQGSRALSFSLASPIIFPEPWSWKTRWEGWKITLQFMSLVSWCMETRLVESFATWRTFFRIGNGFIWISPWPATVVREPPVVEIFLLLGHGVYETNLWEELVIWSVAFETLNTWEVEYLPENAKCSGKGC